MRGSWMGSRMVKCCSCKVYVKEHFSYTFEDGTWCHDCADKAAEEETRKSNHHAADMYGEEVT